MPSVEAEETQAQDLTVHIPALAQQLQDKKNPLTERFRALFTLKNVGGAASIDAIAGCFDDESALFKHECAYCLGQMKDPHANDILTKVLRDTKQDTMVRHEAGEALGAIGSVTSLEVLREFANDPIKEIAETCQIAIDQIEFLEKKKEIESKGEALEGEALANPYASVDPAPPCPKASIASLREIYLDTSKSLFERYRAMFALRNIGNRDAVLALVEGLKDKSALFRHEVGYVLGQIQHPASVDGLIERLQDKEENYMVRHECAEALGSIAHEKCLPILREFAADFQQVVKESCEVALDMYEYETSGAFQYADGITKITSEPAK